MKIWGPDSAVIDIMDAVKKGSRDTHLLGNPYSSTDTIRKHRVAPAPKERASLGGMYRACRNLSVFRLRLDTTQADRGLPVSIFASAPEAAS
jgi:hypothetical protein